MAMRKFYSKIKGQKVKEVPDHVKPMVSTNYLKNEFQRWLDNYHAKYIQTNSIDSPYHVCFGGMAFSYLVALPEERCHLMHQEHAKEHGGTNDQFIAGKSWLLVQVHMSWYQLALRMI
ncbi:uncharacterized protein LOC126706261 isoform X1 [Quercus robur]|uniref:uncharacterized protein LOC126706261 isoform X1 n=1 Tax=Quercus robur TaxID=38942 RepID=UPI0021634A47|nr:uncharacterized protein LOC126706261 isoform X1 [Quercus robur]